MGDHPDTPSEPVQPETTEQPAPESPAEPPSEPAQETPMTPEEAATHHEPGPSGDPVEREVLGSIADGDQIPNTEEEINQEEAPINPAEAEEEAE